MKYPTAVVIYDDDCPACRRTVGWARRNAAGPDAFEFLPCRSTEARRRFPSVGEADCMKAVHVVLPGGRIATGERALPEILLRLRGYRPLAALFRIPGIGILSRPLYAAFARNRRRFGEIPCK